MEVNERWTLNAFIASLKRATKLQRLMEACSIVVAITMTCWCVINNVDPMIDMDKQAASAWKSHERQHESAIKEQMAIQAVYKPLADYYNRKTVVFPTEPTTDDWMRVTDSHAYGAIVTFWTFEKMARASWSDLKKACPISDQDLGIAVAFSLRGSWNEGHAMLWNRIGEKCRTAIGEYRTKSYDANGNSVVYNAEVQARISAERYKHAVNVFEQSHDHYWCEANREECEAKYRREAAAQAEIDKIDKAIKDDAELDQRLAKANQDERAKIVLEETAKRSAWWWTGITLISFLTCMCIGYFGPVDIEREHGGNANFEIGIPRWVFGRPWVRGRGVKKGWKAVVGWNGRCYLQDAEGSRVLIEAGSLSSTFETVTYASLTNRLFDADREIDELKREQASWGRKQVEDRNRLLMLVVEGLRKSTDHQRSETIRTTRLRLLTLIRERLSADTKFIAELDRRAEEDGFTALED